jgi:ribose-phosphate pyrophosphokinase
MFIPVGSPEIEFKMLQFSGGEWHIKLNTRINYSKVDKVIITNRFINMNDLMKVAVAKDALERMGIESFDLVMPYIPYARQDRVNEPGESFTLKVFTDMLNSLKFDKVIVLDPHSDVAPALINNCVQRDNHQYVRMAYHSIPENAHLIIPDAGAVKKGHKLASDISFLSTVQCDKIRDTKTGSLSGFQVYTPSLYGRACLIVDDICDGGGTFMGLAYELKKHGAGPIYLFVTHGIFSKGLEVLKEYFENIYCTNSFMTITNDDFITQYPIQL